MTDIHGYPEPHYIHVPVYPSIDRPRDDLPFPHLEPLAMTSAIVLLYALFAILYVLGLVSFLPRHRLARRPRGRRPFPEPDRRGVLAIGEENPPCRHDDLHPARARPGHRPLRPRFLSDVRPLAMPEDADRRTLQAILAHCQTPAQAGEGTRLTPEQKARQRTYTHVAHELLDELAT